MTVTANLAPLTVICLTVPYTPTVELETIWVAWTVEEIDELEQFEALMWARENETPNSARHDRAPRHCATASGDRTGRGARGAAAERQPLRRLNAWRKRASGRRASGLEDGLHGVQNARQRKDGDLRCP